VERLRQVLASLPLPRWPDGRIVLADPHPATTWARPSNAAGPSQPYNDPEDKEQA
jgi:hypothetical protein